MHRPHVPTRRDLLLGLGAACLLPPAAASAISPESGPTTSPGPSFPRQETALVHEIVRFAHFDLDRVRELVTARPELAKASWDWGFGDWETPLGAASHTGHGDIAELLLSHGARPTLFSAAMLGQLPVVRAFTEATPGIQSTPGPHGIPLLAHARAGGDRAAAVVAYLEEIGGAGGGSVPALSDEDKQRHVGTYVWGKGPGERIEVLVSRRGELSLRVGEGTPRPLVHRGDRAFHPAGAPSVRVRFEVTGGRTAGLTVRDGAMSLSARRE